MYIPVNASQESLVEALRVVSDIVGWYGRPEMEGAPAANMIADLEERVNDVLGGSVIEEATQQPFSLESLRQLNSAVNDTKLPRLSWD